MTKRWKPGFGDAYYFIDSAFNVDIERYDGHSWDDERIAVGNCFNTKDDAHAAAEKVKALLLSLHDNGGSLPDNGNNLVSNLPDKELPELPDWCKVGEWIYTSSEQYLKIKSISIDRKNVKLSNGANWSNQDIIDEVVSARLRPYNSEEMKALVGKVAKDTYGNISFITGYCVNKEVVYSGTTNFTAECLLRSCCFLDNAPCGVLEHRENGEWVK